MKARVKATGDTVTARGIYTRILTHYGMEEVDCYDMSEVEVITDPDYWEKLKHQYAGMAMNALLLTNNIRNGDLEGMRECNTNAMAIAHALVEKLKEEK